jgi:hypothetical protein
MDERELGEFLAEQRKIACATIGPRGLPHVMMLGYVMRDGALWAWTYAKSQKVRNLERRAQATLYAEAGDSYLEYRGAMLECDVVIHREIAAVRRVGVALLDRYGGPALRDAIETQATKRVALEFIPRRRSTYDHRKLGHEAG